MFFVNNKICNCTDKSLILVFDLTLVCLLFHWKLDRSGFGLFAVCNILGFVCFLQFTDHQVHIFGFVCCLQFRDHQVYILGFVCCQQFTDHQVHILGFACCLQFRDHQVYILGFVYCQQFTDHQVHILGFVCCQQFTDHQVYTLGLFLKPRPEPQINSNYLRQPHKAYWSTCISILGF